MTTQPGSATANFKTREKNLFNQMLSFYDNKQFKQSLKNADQILEKYPDHPETLAMKALNMNAQKKKKEAFEFIKKALFKNMANFTCWHVYGILNRNYDDARKAYLNALRYDPNNQNVLRDLGNLQIQLRDYEGYAETRRQILVAKSGIQTHWITYAVALYLSKNYKQALEVLQSFEKTLKENKDKLKKHERNELTLFEGRILEALGDYKKAIDLLQRKGVVANQILLHETCARLYQKLCDKDKAIEHLEELLQLNSSNYKYYNEILKVHGFDKPQSQKYTDEEQAKIQEILEFYEGKLPRAMAHQRILLKLLSGERFKNKLWKYARPLIVKGVPPLIVDLKELYRDSEKVKIIEDMLLQNVESMEKQSILQNEDEEQDPTVQLWLYYYAAQHFYFLRDFNRALSFVNKAIDHTPTVIDLYIVKAKIFKRAGDPKYASQLYDEARKLDLADRYLNAVSSRYKVRSDDLKDAEDTMALFSKEGVGEDLNVHDMQCMWYENEFGFSYLRQKNYRLAAKNFNYIEKHFEQIIEDQFDFHLYALRKFTLNSYFEMLDFEDDIYNNKFAVNSTIGMIKVMKKVDRIKEEELKKMKPEMEEYKASKEYQQLQEELKKKDDDDEYRNDPDPKGYDLYEKCLQDPIGKAVEQASLITKHNQTAKELHAKAIPIFLQKNKLLLALKSLIALVEKNPQYSKTEPMRIIFFKHWLTISEDERIKSFKDERLYKVAVSEVQQLGCPKNIGDLDKMSEDFLKSNPHSIQHTHEYIKLRVKVFDDKNLKKFEEVAITALEQDTLRNNHIADAENVHRTLTKAGANAENYKEKAHSIFKYAKYFQPTA